MFVRHPRHTHSIDLAVICDHTSMFVTHPGHTRSIDLAVICDYISRVALATAKDQNGMCVFIFLILKYCKPYAADDVLE